MIADGKALTSRRSAWPFPEGETVVQSQGAGRRVVGMLRAQEFASRSSSEMLGDTVQCRRDRS
jgi:hypothetical protein